VRLDNRAGLSAEALASLETLAAASPILSDVVAWGLAQSPPRSISDIIVQDEYTHDVLMPHVDAAYLVFDTT
jgi:hypothetical protein